MEASLSVLIIATALIGALIGSFLNVVIHRVPARRSIVHPPSACPQCGARVRARDNVPVISWLLLRGRCRECGEPISRRYPLVELVTAAVFAGVAAVFVPPILAAASAADAAAAALVLVAHLYFAGITIALTAIDLEHHRLPDVIVLPSYAVAVVVFGASALVAGDGERMAIAAAGAGLLFAAYLALALVSPRGMGMGDVKLAGVIGVYLGWAGWAGLAVGTLAAFVLGGLLGLLLIALRKASRSTGIPFGPWMLGGAWIGILLGDPIAQAYLALFGLD